MIDFKTRISSFQVQKLLQESASLRAQVTQAESKRDDVEQQMIEMQSRVNEVCEI